MAANSTSVKLTMKVTSFVLRLLLNIMFYILIVIVIINVSKAAFDFTYQLYGPVTVEKAPGTDVIFQIIKGDSTMDVASKLEANVLIKNKYAFYLKLKLEHSVIMPGTYKLNTSMTYDQILSVITDYTQSLIKDEDTEADTKTDEKTDQDTATD
jgi:UPF0755 protein